MTRPRIGVVHQGHEEKLEAYVRRCETAGAGTEVLFWDGDPEADAARFDGLVLCGGDDVDARRFGEENHPTVELADPRRDEYELRIVRAAAGRGVPLLGVCRGGQVMNVALGGTLIQHVPELPGALPHRGGARHEVDLVEGTLLRTLVGRPRASVNSFHHQAAGRVAPPLRVSARSADGVVEALEGTPGRPFLVGVQWHPEREGNDEPLAQGLFDAFVRAVGNRGK
jgi:putative glutamine amidotransferase